MKLKQLILPALAVALMASSCNAQDKKSGSASLKTPKDSLSYAIGVSIGNNFKNSGLDSLNIDLVAKGIEQFIAGKASLNSQQADLCINTYFSEKEKAKGADNVKKGLAYLEENKKKPGVMVTASGLQYEVMKDGTGPKPTLNDKVSCHYHGTLIDGTVFDSSVERGQPASFPLTGVIPGWTEALQLMKVGSKWRLVLPPELAYGERGAGGKIGPNSVLIFEVELLAIEAPEKEETK